MIIGFIGFVFGIILGSGCYLVVRRVIAEKSLGGRSECEFCHTKLTLYDLLPIFSYLYLGGKCRFCHKKLSREYILSEVALGILISLLFLKLLAPNFTTLFSFSWPAIWLFFEITFKSYAVVIFVAIFLIDLKTGLIPNRLTYPGILISIVYLLTMAASRSYIFYQDLKAHPLGKYLLAKNSTYLTDNLLRFWSSFGLGVLSALLLSGSFALLILITKGKGMGWGDVKYVFLLGLVFGFPGSILAVFLAFLTGAVVSLGLVALRRKHFGQTVPFGPFLSGGAIITLFWGKEILEWYMRLY